MLDNQSYIDKLVSAAEMEDCNVTKNPISKDMLKKAAEEQHDGILLDAQEKTTFQSHAGDFQWLAQTTHPCIATSTSILSTFCANPTPTALLMCKHMIRYLKGTRNRCLIRWKGENSGLQIWVDSDHAGLYKVTGDTRSRMGILVTYNGMPVYWKSSWIKSVCTSSAWNRFDSIP